MKAAALSALLALASLVGAPGIARADDNAPQPAASAQPVAVTPGTAIVRPWPTLPQTTDTVDLEAGGDNSWLNAGRGRWNGVYGNAFFQSTSGFKAYAGWLNTVRFGGNDDGYYAGVYVPTKTPHGTFNAEFGFSPQHVNLPKTEWLANYDLRLDNGFGVQAGYGNRAYNTTTASIWNAGFDKYFGNDRLAYRATISSLTNTPGAGFSQTVSWQKTLPDDAVTAAFNFGRDIENTGFNNVAFYTSATVVVDDVHWIDDHTAIHADVSYNALAGAYQRYEVLLGLRVRL